MTMLDEHALSRALRDAARGIEVPGGAEDRILAAARATVPSSPAAVAVSFLPRTRRTRIALGSAAAVLVAFAISLSFAPTGTSRPTEASTQHRGVLGLPTTPSTIPGSPSFSYGSNGPVSGAVLGGRIAPSNGQKTPGTTPLASKIVSVGAVSLTVGTGRLQAAVNELALIARRNSGFVASSQVFVGTGPSSTSSGTVELRVPESRFATLVRQVQRVGTATSVKTNSTDVTSQFVDLQARIVALGESRAQYLAILAKANSIGDILAIQAQINEIQTQIEQLQGQRNVLDNQAAYGTLDVALTPSGEQPGGRPAAGSGVTTAYNDSVRGFVLGVEGVIRYTGPTLFVLLCLLVLFFLGRFVWRASRRRMI